VYQSEPKWLAALEPPVVYFTLGTIFNLESGDLFERVLEALATMPVSSVVTVGRELDPAQFGDLPERIRLERYIPQASVLPHCGLVISHAGSGSMMGALTYGLPSVLLPLGADQPHNAARCADLGVSRVLDAIRATPADIRDAITDALGKPAYRRAAASLRDEIQRLPSVEYGVDLLERLGATRQPVAAAEART
jgi:MGT family glycosyltransferase